MFEVNVKNVMEEKNLPLREALKKKYRTLVFSKQGGGGSGPAPSKPNPYYEMSIIFLRYI